MSWAIQHLGGRDPDVEVSVMGDGEGRVGACTRKVRTRRTWRPPNKAPMAEASREAFHTGQPLFPEYQHGQ